MIFTYTCERRQFVLLNVKAKAIFVTLLVHFGLLYGLFYLNSDESNNLVPNFVKEWIQTEQPEQKVASNSKRP